MPQAGQLPHLIAWEVTRACLLNCKHCRASACREVTGDELSTAECFKLLDNIASFAKPIIILTGGEPMLREDIYDIAAYAHRLDLPVVMAPCGMLLNDQTAAKIVASGVRRISISLDAATAEAHDAFRGQVGSFQACIDGIAAAKRAGLDFQINTTISQHNIEQLEAIMKLAIGLGASVFNPFLLVPTGRGANLADQELSPVQYERTLQWLAARQADSTIPIRVTCAPHYQRILRQCVAGVSPAASARGMGVSPMRLAGVSPADSQPKPGQDGRETHGRDAHATGPRGCMGGKSFAFISHVGKVQICGFLDVECGDVRQAGYDFRKIWETSPVFLKLRDQTAYHGRCGYCEFHKVCGGCRARAYAMIGDYLGEEPFCIYQPRKKTVRPEDRETARPEGPETGETKDRLPDSRSHGPTVSRSCGPMARDERAEHDNHPQRSPDDLTDHERTILTAIQIELPVMQQPFDVLAERLSIPAEIVLDNVRRLVEDGFIRRVGAVFDTRHMGYVSTLVAGRIPPERLDDVARQVSDLAGVTHNYRREGAYNLWFTLTAASQPALDQLLAELRARTGIGAFFSLPSLAMYKTQVLFDLTRRPDDREAVGPEDRGTVGPEDRETERPADEAGEETAAGSPAFDERQKALIRRLQESLPLTEQPFDALAGQLEGWSAAHIRRQIHEWLFAGVIRRVGAVVNHRRLGFVANGMAVFHVDPAAADELGRRIARHAEVSHCYLRPPLSDWPYNLFAMIHGTSVEQVRASAAQIAQELGLSDYEVLFSTAEFKKVSMRYFVE